MPFGFRAYHIAFLCALLCSALSCVSMNNSLTRRGVSQKLDDAEVRILLFNAAGPVSISSGKGIRIAEMLQTGRSPGKLVQSIVISPDKIVTAMFIETADSYIEVNGRRFRGSIELRRANKLVCVINIVKVRDYLMSVVPGEIPAGWESEALKAQAVAARTYLYYHMARNRSRGGGLYDLASDGNSQVYKGIEVERPGTTDAVLNTAGEIIVHRNMPIISYFHSTCGGKTIDGKYVWSRNDLEYLRGVVCEFCKESTKYEWESALTLEEMRTHLQKGRGPIGAISSISFKKKDGRVVAVSIMHSGGKVRISGNNFRLLFPDDKIRSLYFTSKKNSAGLLLSGHGWGHGVGMCQWGARGMAKKGFTYKSILKHYYSNISIDRVKNNYAASDIVQYHNYP